MNSDQKKTATLQGVDEVLNVLHTVKNRHRGAVNPNAFDCVLWVKVGTDLLRHRGMTGSHMKNFVAHMVKHFPQASNEMGSGPMPTG